MKSEKIKRLRRSIADWFFPTTNDEIDRKIDENNIKNIHNLCLIASIIQFCSIVFYALVHSGELDKAERLTSVLHVSISIVLLVATYILTGVIMKKKSDLEGKAFTNVIIIILMAALLIWGELASVKHYVSNRQMLTFYTVELCVALFVKLKPVVSISLITVSSLSYFAYLNWFVKPGIINFYNYAMFFALLIAGSMYSYRYTVNNIKQRNRIELLNNNLRIIANHDSMTRLRNRYSLNQKIAEYTGREVCLAMLDINKFKAINDTNGHPFGDEVLKLVADKMLEVFNRDNIFRYGGDEFLVLEDGNNLERFRKRLKRVNKSLENSRIRGTDITIRCCFGCVQGYIESPDKFMKLIDIADKKLYEEKQKNI